MVAFFMVKPQLIYCYDAWCGWCYGFSNVMKKIETHYEGKMEFEVLSGGMILPEKPVHISATAGYIESAYKRVEELTGVEFGEDYLWHIRQPGESDWYPDSLKAAIALVILKELIPGREISMASELQYALHFEGRDLTDNEAYRHLLEKYDLPAEDFYTKLASAEYEDKARYEFALVKQLQVTGFPAVLIRKEGLKFYLVASGFTPYDTLVERIENVLEG